MKKVPPLSLQEALTHATRALKEAGVDTPRLDAEILLAEVLGLQRHQLYIMLNEPLETTHLRTFRSLVKKRSRRIPLQYITGHVEFMSMDFLVKSGIFIPRPETELVVEAVLQRADPSQETKIIDIGTGCGNIAICLALHLPRARLYASDVSQKALRLARLNATRYMVEDRVSFLLGPMYEAFTGLGLEGKVDFIVSNPPYVPEGQKEGLQPEVRDYESPQALLGGRDGLDFYRPIVGGTWRWLSPGGWLILEVGDSQADKLRGLITQGGHLDSIETIRDLQGIERVIIARAPDG